MLFRSILPLLYHDMTPLPSTLSVHLAPSSIKLPEIVTVTGVDPIRVTTGGVVSAVVIVNVEFIGGSAISPLPLYAHVSDVFATPSI